MPINVAELQCDMLSATGRKYLRGPRGVGFLYVREALIETLEPPIIDHYAANWTAPDAYTLRPDARRFENWENNYAAKLGLGVAVDYALHWGLDAIQERVTSLAEYMREKVAAVDGVEVMDLGINRSGIVTFIKADEDPTEVKRRLGAQAINLSVSNPESTLLDATRRKLPPLVRASVHYYNTKAEIERMARVLAV
jgi:selenocysteine lyase/cysteine desulfurase